MYNMLMEKNTLIAMARNERVRIYLLNSKDVVEEARKLFDLWPTSCAALGRVLSVTALMGLMQKQEGETVTVSFSGGGPIGNILCVGNSKGEVKGFCGDPHIYEKYDDTGKLAVGRAVGTDGYLSVTRNLQMKQNYTSQVKIRSGEIGDDMAYYFLVSEQVPTIVSLGVLVDTDDTVKSAGAMIIELLPDHTEEDIAYLEALKLRPISRVFDEDPDIHHYLHELFPDAAILDEREVRYHCDCSKDRFRQKLLTLSADDLKELAKDDHLDIKCEFCNRHYVFDGDDMRSLLENV